MRKAGLVAVVVVVVLSLTGAGLFFTSTDASGPTEEAPGLAARYQRITADLQAESEALRAEAEGAAAGGSEPQEVLELYGDLILTTNRARDAYASLDVPANMRSARQRLVRALQQRTEVIDRLMTAVRSSDETAANNAATDLVGTARTFGEAQNEMLRLIQECGSACE